MTSDSAAPDPADPVFIWALTPGLGHVESSSCWRKRDDQDYGQEELLR